MLSFGAGRLDALIFKKLLDHRAAQSCAVTFIAA